MNGITWLVIGLLVGTLFGAVMFGWLFENFWDGVGIFKEAVNISR